MPSGRIARTLVRQHLTQPRARTYSKITEKHRSAAEAGRLPPSQGGGLPMIRLTVLAVSMALLAGCAAASRPQPGVVWSYTSTSGSMPNFRGIFYAPGKVLCEASLAKDRHELPKNHAWAQMTIGDGCKETLLSPGNDYWIFRVTVGSYSDLGAGATTQETCGLLRNGFKQQRYWPSECVPMGVRFLNQQ